MDARAEEIFQARLNSILYTRVRPLLKRIREDLLELEGLVCVHAQGSSTEDRAQARRECLNRSPAPSSSPRSSELEESVPSPGSSEEEAAERAAAPRRSRSRSPRGPRRR